MHWGLCSNIFMYISGWVTHQAIRVARAVANLDVYIEQPCVTLEECISVKSRVSTLPMILDECVNDMRSLLAVWHEGAADVVNIKISKFGGLTKAKQVNNNSNILCAN